jgi:hypothetical protein
LLNPAFPVAASFQLAESGLPHRPGNLGKIDREWGMGGLSIAR